MWKIYLSLFCRLLSLGFCCLSLFSVYEGFMEFIIHGHEGAGFINLGVAWVLTMIAWIVDKVNEVYLKAK